MKINKIILLSLVTIMMFAAACKKETGLNTTEQLPVLTTSDVNVITNTAAAGGGKLISDGGTAISAIGICWSTNAEPTIADRKTTEEPGTVTFTSALTGLTNATVYNVRAYATNSRGTAYGNTVTFAALKIGQEYLGGKVAYVLIPEDPGYTAGIAHGLTISPQERNDLGWFNGTYTTTGATAAALGAGNANTDLIVSKLGTGNYSAAACSSEISSSFTDWHLPSKDELNKLYLARDKLSGVFSSGYYWSSTEEGSSTAWIQSFTTGVQSTYDKNGKGFWTHAVRSF